MAAVRWLFLFRVVLGRPPAVPTCVKETLNSRRHILTRGLFSPAVEVAEETSESARAAEETRPQCKWSPLSRRTGAIAVKLGMTQLWDSVGEPVPVTVLQVCILAV